MNTVTEVTGTASGDFREAKSQQEGQCWPRVPHVASGKGKEAKRQSPEHWFMLEFVSPEPAGKGALGAYQPTTNFKPGRFKFVQKVADVI